MFILIYRNINQNVLLKFSPVFCAHNASQMATQPRSKAALHERNSLFKKSDEA